MTSDINEKDNLLPTEAEGQDRNLTENQADNQTAEPQAPAEPVSPAPEQAAPAEESAQPEPQASDLPAEQPVEGTPDVPAEVNENAEKQASSPAEKAEKPKEPAKDYHKLTAEELVAELHQLLENEPIQHIGRQARSIKEAFDALTAPAKNEESGEEPAGAQEEDKVLANAKEQFNALWDEFRKKREKFAAQMAVEQKANLEERLALIEELKQLIEKEENASIRDFHSIQIRWRKCGMVPREQSSAVWQTYQHHVERFFDYLKLNREFRDMEFERNLAEKN